MAAIYQWFSPGEEQTFTTTLYPLESVEGVQVSASINTTTMSLIPFDNLEVAASFLSAEYNMLLIEDGPYLDELSISPSLLTVDYNEILIEDGPYPDTLEVAAAFLSAEYTRLLIEIYAPDEAIQITAAINEGDCAMTPV